MDDSPASAGAGTPSTGRYGYMPSPPPTGAKFMSGTLNTLRALEDPDSLDIGSPAAGPIRSRFVHKNPAKASIGRVQSGLSGSQADRLEKAEKSVRLWIELLEKQYDYEDAKTLKDAFFKTEKRLRTRLGSRSASGPAKVSTEPSIKRHAQLIPVKARGTSSAEADYDEIEVFDKDKYYEYIKYKLASEGKGDLLSGLLGRLYELQTGVGNEDISRKLEEIINALQDLERKQKEKEDEFDAMLRLKKTPAETDAMLDEEEKSKREAFNKRREAAAKAYAIINNVEKPKIKGLKGLISEIQAKIRAKAAAAPAGGGAGTYGSSRIYTLRAKRRNVRNKEKRRTRKGLVRQGSRPHRKTRRRA